MIILHRFTDEFYSFYGNLIKDTGYVWHLDTIEQFLSGKGVRIIKWDKKFGNYKSPLEFQVPEDLYIRITMGFKL